jgi:hypothetical protein
VNSAIVSKEEVSTNEGISAFHAFERPLFSVRSLMSAPMFTATERAIAELTTVLFLGRRRLVRE